MFCGSPTQMYKSESREIADSFSFEPKIAIIRGASAALARIPSLNGHENHTCSDWYASDSGLTRRESVENGVEQNSHTFLRYHAELSVVINTHVLFLFKINTVPASSLSGTLWLALPLSCRLPLISSKRVCLLRSYQVCIVVGVDDTHSLLSLFYAASHISHERAIGKAALNEYKTNHPEKFHH